MNITPTKPDIKFNRSNIANRIRRLVGNLYNDASRSQKSKTINTMMMIVRDKMGDLKEGSLVSRDFLTEIIENNEKELTEFLSLASDTREIRGEKRELDREAKEAAKEIKEVEKERSKLTFKKFAKRDELIQELDRVKIAINEAGLKMGVPNALGFIGALKSENPTMYTSLTRRLKEVDTPEEAVALIKEYSKKSAVYEGIRKPENLRKFITQPQSPLEEEEAQEEEAGFADTREELEKEQDEEKEEEEFEEEAQDVYNKGTDTGKEREEIADIDNPRAVFDQAVDFVEQMSNNPIANEFIDMIEDNVGDNTPPLRNILGQANKVIEEAMKKGLKRPRFLVRQDKLAAESAAAQSKVQAEMASEKEELLKEKDLKQGPSSGGFRETPVSVQDLKPVGDQGPPEDLADFESGSQWNSQTGNFSYTLENPYPEPPQDLTRPEPSKPQRITMSQLPRRRERANPYMALLLSSSSRRGSARLSRSVIDRQSVEKFINMDINHKDFKQLQDHEPVAVNKLTPWYKPTYQRKDTRIFGY